MLTLTKKTSEHPGETVSGKQVLVKRQERGEGGAMPTGPWVNRAGRKKKKG